MANMKDNNEKMKDIICRYIDGETYASIGSRYNTSRQAVELVIRTFAAGILTEGRKRYTKRGAPEKPPFARKNLAEWMKEQRYTVNKLAEELHISGAALYSFLNGRTCLRGNSLSALSSLTGLSLDKLIATEEA